MGKSQLSKRYCKNAFSDSQTTVGLEFATKKIPFERCTVMAQIWDTAGQERFDSMTKAFYRDAVGAFLIFDLTNPKSLENLKKTWIPQLQEFGYSGIKSILIGNKSDKIPKANQSKLVAEARAEAKAFALSEGMDYVETSAKDGEGVEVAFRRLILYIASLLPDVSVHLENSGLPEGWLFIEELEGNNLPGLKYRNYWTDEVTRLKTPPSKPAPAHCIYEHVKVKLPDENKRRMSKSMRGSSISTASMTSSDNINILNVSSKSSFSEVDSQHLVPKSSGSRCADLCVMS